jgi:hypothetical protein
MRVRGVLAALFILAAIAGTPSVALAFNQQITVYASVPEMRNIYVNKAGNITKIVGNTAKNIEPTVLDENNQTLIMTESISKQYEAFLKAHHNHIEASKYYYLNPLTVNSQPNNQNIKINTASLTF